SRGAAVAMMLGALGAIVGAGCGVRTLLQAEHQPQLQAVAGPVVRLERPAPVVDKAPPPDAAPTRAVPAVGKDDTAMAVVPPIAPATFVRVLPAVAAPPEEEPITRASGQDWGPPRR